GIRFVGEHVARVLAQEFKSLDNIKKTSREQLQQVYEIGPQVAESVYQFFHEEQNLKTIERLLQSGIKIREVEAPTDKKFAGKSFVFTGTLQHHTRDEAESLVESLGGRAASSVSRNTHYVVVGENPGSKAQKARELGIPILSEEEFMKIAESK
ncbi:MAG: helix-hairpin-helix domain-containing protein, partial [bacterium]